MHLYEQIRIHSPDFESNKTKPDACFRNYNRYTIMILERRKTLLAFKSPYKKKSPAIKSCRAFDDVKMKS